MNKTELVDQLAATTSLSKADAGRTIDALFDVHKGIIATALKSGSKVQITGFGTFETRQRGARMGRNPRTGERIQIPASVSPAFRAGKGLKDGVKP
ncbi:MAG: HU family DNA-binding protein [Gemmatimonadota bacterium]